MIYSVYILYSDSKNSYYTGSTVDLTDRLKRHNKGRSKATKFGVPWRLVYCEKYSSRPEAVSREKEIKSYHGGKAFRKLISKYRVSSGEVA